ncbi:trypsin-like peptidase domain-containing protein [Pseudenhygromyxa sp. WMMC2535]|uniref:S1C family serine protease n=1 Tax=Pseudenhygromyxa sp. WMMC2535 TaxID=2712867 RepID=UPI001552CDE5|nr:trypsin-like peptidase domain-containing protein [Pseudenhygromyxa sp. WMMC2535]NVB37889.1 trypsin-like peptidase domain-containing protein [Pseudenhygromyxa sp. WMMC2535]
MAAASSARHVLAFALAVVAAVGCRRVEEQANEQEPAMVRVRPEPAPLAVDSQASAAVVELPNFASVAEDVGPSVVGVISTVETGETKLRGIGSGMIVSAQGQILTNEHVITGARALEVQLPDDTAVAADLIVADPLLDLALLQLRGDFSGLLPVEFRDRDPRPGEWIMAIGQPFALGDTVTVGVVSGLGRDYADLGRPRDLDPAGIWSFIQTDASINVGNSGGPLVDLEGKVVGITTAVRRDGQGLAFAIPSAMAIRFVDEVRTYGRMRHTRLGIGADDEYDVPGLASAVRVTRVDRDGPGARAQLEVGDLVIAINGRRVSRVSEVAYLTQLAGVGTKLTLTIVRGKDERTLQPVIVPELAT